MSIQYVCFYKRYQPIIHTASYCFLVQADSNSLKMTNDVTNETDEQQQGMEDELNNAGATSQADHSEL